MSEVLSHLKKSVEDSRARMVSLQEQKRELTRQMQKQKVVRYVEERNILRHGDELAWIRLESRLAKELGKWK